LTNEFYSAFAKIECDLVRGDFSEVVQAASV
jgi:hypothetical protein